MADLMLPESEVSAEWLRAADEALIKFGNDLKTLRDTKQELDLMFEQNKALERDVADAKKTIFDLLTDSVHLAKLTHFKEFSEAIEQEISSLSSSKAKDAKK